MISLFIFSFLIFVKIQIISCEQFDFIVVGAGPAGSAVAARLSEDCQTKVLLLEAGGEPEILNDIPYFAFGPLGGQLDWSFLSEPQKNSCQAFPGNKCPWFSGKGLGGGTLINGMIYSRVMAEDYDSWEKLGNEGWGYKDVLPYFKRAEDFTGPLTEENRKLYGTGGPITLSQPPYKSELYPMYVKAGEELGYPNGNTGKQNKGFYNTLYHVRNGARCSAYRGYLEPARNRSNFKIVTNALVRKVIFDDKNRATGVEYDIKGKIFESRVSKEVIISAGSKKSPQILMLSGIGPKGLLEKHNIKIVSDLPGMGKNLQDHIGLWGLEAILKTDKALISYRDVNAETLEMWETKRQGPLTVPCSCEGYGLVNSPENKSPDWPDLELIFYTNPYPSVFKEEYNFPMIPNVYESPFFPIIVVLRPKSVGYMEIKSADPHDNPLYHANYLSEPEDVAKLIAAVRIFQKFLNTTTFQKYEARINLTSPIKGCEEHKFFSDDYLKCHFRHFANGLFHVSGTCKMGPKSDHMAVVDARLRVNGVKNVRVADLSICPNIVSGHPTITAYMIGEKAAQIIKDDWKINPKNK